MHVLLRATAASAHQLVSLQLKLSLISISVIDEFRGNRDLAHRAEHSIQLQSVLLSGSVDEISEAQSGADDVRRVASEDNRRVLRGSGAGVPVVDDTGGRGNVGTVGRRQEVGPQTGAQLLEVGSVVLIHSHHPADQLFVAIRVVQVLHFCIDCCLDSLQILPAVGVSEQ